MTSILMRRDHAVAAFDNDGLASMVAFDLNEANDDGYTPYWVTGDIPMISSSVEALNLRELEKARGNTRGF